QITSDQISIFMERLRCLLERQTVGNAPKYANNSVGESARVGRGPAEFTSAGRGGACRPHETRLERRSVKPIGVLACPADCARSRDAPGSVAFGTLAFIDYRRGRRTRNVEPT